jgi:hypothetical protein
MPYGSLVNVTTNDTNKMDIDNHEEENAGEQLQKLSRRSKREKGL